MDMDGLLYPSLEGSVSSWSSASRSDSLSRWQSLLTGQRSPSESMVQMMPMTYWNSYRCPLTYILVLEVPEMVIILSQRSEDLMISSLPIRALAAARHKYSLGSSLTRMSRSNLVLTGT